MHRPSSGPQDELTLAIAEATAAFDAANHAFGRFVTYVVRRQSQTVPEPVQFVREALQDAALAVPQETTVEATREFLSTLLLAEARLAVFFQTPPNYALEEARPATEALAEAIDALRRVVGPPTARP